MELCPGGGIRAHYPATPSLQYSKMNPTIGALFTSLAYVVGAAVFYVAARRKRMDTEGTGRVAVAGLAGGLLGAKLTEWAVAHFTALAAHLASVLDPRNGGRTLIGGVICGWICVELAKRRLGIRRSTGDLFALALPAGETVGRIGCFFNGCCYGTVSRVPWAVYQHGAWRHPSQLYASGAAAAILVILLALRTRLQREGDLFKVYLLFYGVSRFLVEFTRERSLSFVGLSLAQAVCLELALAAAIGLALSYRRPAPQAAGA